MSAYWKTLSHSGVNFPDQYEPTGLTVRVGGKEVALSPLAEEMAYHLAKKKDTPYVQDQVFTSNFMRDFSRQLPPWCKGARFSDVDFSKFYTRVDGEKAAKEAMGKEQKKALAASRKERREALKSRYGKATLDGKEVDIANWLVEPPGLFMGRGCLPSDTLVMTQGGPKHVGELAAGELIATHHGSDKMFFGLISSVAPQGVRPTFSLRTRHFSIVATGNHPFLALNVRKVQERSSKGRFSGRKYPATLSWVRLSGLNRGDLVVTVRRYNSAKTSKYSNSAKRTFGNVIITPGYARLLGYYLGDGFNNRRKSGANSHISFSEGHADLIKYYSNLCREVFGISPSVVDHRGGNSQVIRVYSAEFAGVLESLGVTGKALKKRVPSWTFQLADDLKCAFIRGYLDADGHFRTTVIRKVQYGSFEFESTNRRLIEDLRELCRSAGLEPSNFSHRDNHGFAKGRHFRFLLNEYSSVLRLLDPGESLDGSRTRFYSSERRAAGLRERWDWSRLHILDSEFFCLERVLEVKQSGSVLTHDVSMADTKEQNFVANGFVVHNSHPLRGRWKPRVSHSDVVLNLGESSPVPPGSWKEVVHDHNSMWMAKWVDKLTEKEKYVWLHEGSPIQQSRNKAKYDKALVVGASLEKIRARISRDLDSKDERSKQVATVCYLIDRLGMRVGDEKDEDEADTVGATTLRVEHLKIDGNSVEFKFIGKDSVPWHKEDAPPSSVLRNLRTFMAGKPPSSDLFHDVNSQMVNQFLSSIVHGLSAKVFRTYHATATADEALHSKDVRDEEDLGKVFHAKEANLKAAIFCNHQRTPPKTWEQSLEKKRLTLEEAKARSGSDDRRVRKLERELDFYVRTKNYNLNTSMKNYIDPRVYKSWCEEVGLDWAKVYSKSLQKKFSWASPDPRG
ncbi:MAG: hypothetical protein HY297_02150 [Thaumarchaeota archaeon]|nr:hypothetical protein [Nitrososphaerota archaeon]